MNTLSRTDVDAYAASINGKVRQWSTPMNGFEPWDKRYREAHGYAVEYQYDGQRAFVFGGDAHDETAAELLRKSAGTLVLVDDGATVDPFYVAAYRFEPSRVAGLMDVDGIDPMLILRRVNPLTGWQLSPRKAYHVKIV